MLITVVELPQYIKRAEIIFTSEERNELLYYLSANPKAGSLLKGAGGVRKLRWGSKGRGKSGGSRVIYFFHSESYPLFLLTLFNKNEKINISKAEQNELAKLTKELINSYKR